MKEVIKILNEKIDFLNIFNEISKEIKNINFNKIEKIINYL